MSVTASFAFPETLQDITEKPSQRCSDMDKLYNIKPLESMDLNENIKSFSGSFLGETGNGCCEGRAPLGLYVRILDIWLIVYYC